MKNLLFIFLFLQPLSLLAKDIDTVLTGPDVKTVTSPENRAVLLELYTSEGCSSCPPADRFLSELKATGISSKQLIPVAFHVTYWDYIGWKDPFANQQFDERQRDLARKQKASTVYTPQFILAGGDYRSHATFSEDVSKLAAQKATVNIVLTSRVIQNNENGDKLSLELKTDSSSSEVKNVGFYLAVIENNLVSDIQDGENVGEVLHHDYVVRQLSGPFFQSQSDNSQGIEHTILLQSEWKRKDLSIVAFAENQHTGEILQAVRLKY